MTRLLSRGLRALEPEGAEPRELLRLSRPGANGETTGRQPVLLAPADRAEVAGTQKHAELVELARLVDGCMHPQASKAQVVCNPHRRIVIVEQVRCVRNRGRPPVRDFEHLDAGPVQEAAWEEADLEWQALAAPQCAVLPEADAAILVVGH